MTPVCNSECEWQREAEGGEGSEAWHSLPQEFPPPFVRVRVTEHLSLSRNEPLLIPLCVVS